jgi:hypothetical protein
LAEAHSRRERAAVKCEGRQKSSSCGVIKTETRFRQAFLLLLVATISAAFVAMIRAFVLTILLAAIFTGLSYPVYRWLLRWARGHEALAAIARSFCCCCWSSHRCSQYLEPGQTERYESPRPSGRASNNSWTSRARAIQPVGSVAIDPVE